MNANLSEFNKYTALFKDKKVVNVLSFYVLSQEAKAKSVWAPMLTPYIGKEKVLDFCNNFNKESSLLYSKDIIVPVLFILYKNKSYHFVLKSPTFFFLLKFLFELDKLYRLKKKKIYYVTLEELWYILFIKYNFYAILSQKATLISFIKLLKNFGIKIIV